MAKPRPRRAAKIPSTAVREAVTNVETSPMTAVNAELAEAASNIVEKIAYATLPGAGRTGANGRRPNTAVHRHHTSIPAQCKNTTHKRPKKKDNPIMEPNKPKKSRADISIMAKNPVNMNYNPHKPNKRHN